MGKNKSGKKVKIVSDLDFVADGLSDKKMRKQIKKIEKQNNKAEKKKKEQESFFAFKLNVSNDEIQVNKHVDQFFVEDDNDDIEIYDVSLDVENLRKDATNNKIIKHSINDKEYVFISKDDITLLSISAIVSDMFVDGYNNCLDKLNPPYKRVIWNDIITHDENSSSCGCINGCDGCLPFSEDD